ncbi:MAG TPA: hypothetical protein VNO30_01370 [Kofleriaceae bacterium]|nr:hypothetical protein [Kofleriaceae bacterium]
MKPVRYDEDADEELIDEIARYELRREGLGIEFLTAVREAVRLITQNPGAWQASEHAPDVRRFVMQRFHSRSSIPSLPRRSSSSRWPTRAANPATGAGGCRGYEERKLAAKIGHLDRAILDTTGRSLLR